MKKIEFPLRARKSAPAVEPRLVPLEGGLGQAVYALAAGMRFRESDWPDRVDAEWPVYESGVRLARQIVDSVLADRGASADAELKRAADDHVERVAELARERDAGPFSMDGLQPTNDELGFATAALREQAMEHHDAEVLVATDRSDAHVLLASPVSVEQANVWLLGPLLEKVEAWVQEDPLIFLERAASGWWFSRWRAPRPLAGDEFAGGVREQEFSLADRSLCVLGKSPLEHLVEEGMLRRIGRRQQHIAARLIESEVGVWTVASREGNRAVFVSARDGARYEVREHADDNGYGTDFLALGRLIPFGDGTWLRSPGTFLMSYGRRSAELARDLGEGLNTRLGDLPLAAAVELAAYSLAGVRGLPRNPLPAPSPDEAAELGRELNLLLREAGLAQTVDPTSAPAARLAARNPDTEILEFEVDNVLAEFMQAIFEQSRKSKAFRDVKRRRARDARKKKGRGRR